VYVKGRGAKGRQSLMEDGKGRNKKEWRRVSAREWKDEKV
jgi:hypothetical protein